MCEKFLLQEGKQYALYRFRNEKAFERCVLKHTKDVFGDASEYFNLKPKLEAVYGKGTVPDGYLISFIKPYNWYLVEFELLRAVPISKAKHDHIAGQLQNFKNIEQWNDVRKAIYSTIKKHRNLDKKIQKLIGEQDLPLFLETTIFSKEPTIIVVIEQTDVTNEVAKMCEPFGGQVIEFETFAHENCLTDHIHRFNFLSVARQPVSKGGRKFEAEPQEGGKGTSPLGLLDYTKTKPKSFMFNGKRYEAFSWKSLLILLCEEVANLQKDKFDKVLKLKGTKRSYFSVDKTKIKTPTKIGTTDLFVETNLNANLVVKLCNRVLSLFEYDTPLLLELSSQKTRETREKKEKPIKLSATKRAKRGDNTPREAYVHPILEALIELGGSGKVKTILNKLFEKMKDKMTEKDLEKQPSGNAIRWKNIAQWARQDLVNKGYLKKDSQRGTWEITEPGRTFYESKKEKQVSVT